MKKLLKHLCWLVLFVTSCTSPPPGYLTVRDMKKDINTYFTTQQELCPELYLRYSPSQIDSVKKDLLKRCSSQMSLSEFAYEMARTNKYFDSHTGMLPGDFLPSVGQSIYSTPPDVYFGEDYLLYGDNDTLYTINGVPAKELINELDLLVSWEYHPEIRRRLMNDYLFPVLDKVFHTTFQPMSLLGERFPVIDSRYRKYPLYYEYYPADSIAVLFYNSSMIYGRPWMEEILDNQTKDFFEAPEMQHIKYLFIDVLNNGGGSDLAHEYIFRYLKAQPVQINVKTKATPKGIRRLYDSFMETQEETPADITPEAEAMRQSFINEYLTPLMKTNGGWLENVEDYEGRETGFEGKVFILMGVNTFSAAYNFCEMAKRRQMALLIGSEPGQRVPSCANMFIDTLPVSKLPFKVTTWFFAREPAVPNRDGFLQPDIPYTFDRCPTMEDFKEIIRKSNDLTPN